MEDISKAFAIQLRYYLNLNHLSQVNRIVTSPKTTDSYRNVFVQPELRNCILNIRELMSSQPVNSKHFIFMPDGSRISYYSYNEYLNREAFRILGRKDISTHVLRHTHTSLLAECGVPLETISRRLGHENSKITKAVYLHVTKTIKKNDDLILSRIIILDHDA